MFKTIFGFFKFILSKRDATGKLGKSWWRSKSLWVFGLGTLFSALSWFGVLPADMQFEGDVQLTVTNFIGLILRLITNEPVGFKDV